MIVYVPSPRDGPYRVSRRGTVERGRGFRPSRASHAGGWFPSFLPDGRHFLEFVPTVKQPGNAGVWVVSLETGSARDCSTPSRMRSMRRDTSFSGRQEDSGPSPSMRERFD